MKRIVILSIFISSVIVSMSQNLKPYIIGFESSEGVAFVKEKLVENLENQQIQIVGQYQPASDKSRWIIVYTTNDLIDAVKSIGGLTGFASTQRIAITREGDKTIVSYTNPVYWGNAYFRDSFDKVSSKYSSLEMKLKKAMTASGTYVGKQFGSEEGVEIDDLREYKYMFGMPQFDDTIELGEFDSFKSALAKINTNLKTGIANLTEVYRVEVPGKDMVLLGFALNGSEGEANFMPTIDIGSPKHTAFLPYEVLVKGDEIHMLHGRYRIALSFPDLTMGTFSKIMSTPGDIEKMLEQLVE